MNPLLARVRKRNAPKYYKLLSDEVIYSLDPATLDFVNYSPDHNLDGDSWFAVDAFSYQDFSLRILTDPYVDAEYNQLPNNYFPKISFLLNITDEGYGNPPKN